MSERSELSRRRLIGSTGGAIVASCLPWGQLPVRAQDRWTPDRGLRIGGPFTALSTLDPALSRDLPTLLIVRQIFRGLLRFDSSLNAVSDLADLIETSADSRRFTFRLGEGVSFGDGRAITSEDVAASFTRALDPATAGGSIDGLGAVTYLGDIQGAPDVLAGSGSALTGVSIIDERTLSIDLEAPSATFLLRLASVATAIVDVTETARDPEFWWTSPNATGPFTVESFSSDEIRLIPNPSYMGQTPSLESISVVTGVAAAQPFNLYQNNEVDLVLGAPGNSAGLVEDPASAIGATVYRTPLFATTYIALGNRTPPLDDPHVRRALQRLMSPELVAGSMFYGAVSPATGIIPSGMLGRDWPGNVPGQDFEAARAELAASRYASVEDVPTISVFAADIELVEALRDIAAVELGLTIEAVAVNWADFLRGLIERHFPAYSIYWGADYPDPEAFLDMLFHSNGSDNYTGYSNEAFDAILDQARRESDVDRRAALYIEAQYLLLDDGAVIPLYFDVAINLARPGIAGLEITSMGVLGLESVTAES